MQENDSPRILPAILISVAAIVAFFVVQFRAALLLGIIALVLSHIPLLGAAANFLFSSRGDTPALLAIYITSVLAYETARFTAARFAAHQKTAALALLLAGAIVAIIHGFCLVYNIRTGSSILVNIAQIVTGLIMVFKGKAEL